MRCTNKKESSLVGRAPRGSLYVKSAFADAQSLLFVNRHYEESIMAYQQFVFTTRASFMQRLSDFVRLGSYRWTSGECPLEGGRVHALVRKFCALYRVDATRGQRLRMMRSGIASAHLLMYARRTTNGANPRTILWFLLVSDGEHPASISEKLRDAHAPGERIRMGGYELVQLPRKDSVKPAWTWRMTVERYQSWRDRVVESARKPALRAERDITKKLYSTPGFAGVRSQVGFIVGLWRREWKRRRAASEQFPQLPKLYYCQRLKSVGVQLSQLTRDAARAVEPTAAGTRAARKSAHQKRPESAPNFAPARAPDAASPEASPSAPTASPSMR